MNYDNFEASFTKENKKLKVALALAILISLTALVLQFFDRRYFLYKGGAIFEERPLAEEVCRVAFAGLAGGTPNPHVVHEEVIKLAEKDNFSLAIDKIFQVKSLEEGSCKIVLKSEGALTAFKIKLQASDKYPFYYKLIQLDEISAKEEI
ncbi:MAG: hypothetical protein AB7I27_17800 [Bacteriovoracaceae bacterium]